MIAKKTVCFVFLFFILQSINSQKISGFVRDNKGIKVDGCHVLIKSYDNKDKINEYTTTKNGYYEITLKKKYNKILIETDYIGFFNDYKIIDKPQKKKSYLLDFNISRDTISSNKLDEVIIIANKKPFTVKKDTVSYNVKSYLNGSERKIEDVIKKLPGIQVDKSTGIIKYKNKPIENITLDGDDLFGKNYTLGTKNINVDLVSEIEAIENYSKNPLLKGLEKDEKVSLNLKLKENKIDISGNFDIGSGVNSDINATRDFNLNLLGITKRHKSFSTLSQNNIGKNKSPFNYLEFNSNLENFFEKEKKAPKFIPEFYFSNFLDNERVNINNQFFSNFNSVFKINSKLKSRMNLYYINDKVSGKNLLENNFRVNNDFFTRIDSYSITKKPKLYRGDIEMVLNSSKSSLMRYNLSIRDEDIKSFSDFKSKKINSLLNTNDFFLTQSLSYTKRLSNKNAIQLSINHFYNKIPQLFEITPSILSNYNKSDNQNNKFTKHFLEGKATLFGATEKKNKYNFIFGGKTIYSQFTSQLKSINQSNIIELINRNNVDYSSSQIYQSGNFKFKLNKWELTPKYNLVISKQKLNSSSSDFFIEPSFNFRFKANPISSFTGSFSLNMSSLAENYIFENSVLTNNRTIISNNNNLNLRQQIRYALSYNLNDIYNLLELNFRINYQDIKGGFLSNSNIDQDITNIKYSYLPVNNNSLNAEFNVNKYVPFLKSTTKLKFNYSLSNYKNIVNNSDLRNNQGKIYNAEFNLKTAFRSFINFENNLSYTKNISSTHNNNDIIVNESLNNSFDLILKPSKNIFLLFTSDYFIPNYGTKTKNYMFLDLSLRYFLNDNGLEFNFYIKNLLNEKNFEEFLVSDISSSVLKTSLLPNYYLISISYDF